MQLNIALFGITKEIVGQSELAFTVPEASTVQELQTRLAAEYPRFRELRSLVVAVNSEYAEPAYQLRETDEIALIPPVSGG